MKHIQESHSDGQDVWEPLAADELWLRDGLRVQSPPGFCVSVEVHFLLTGVAIVKMEADLTAYGAEDRIGNS